MRNLQIRVLISIWPAHHQPDLQTLCLIQLLLRVELHLHKVLIALTVCQWRQTTSALHLESAPPQSCPAAKGQEFGRQFVAFAVFLIRQSESIHIHRTSTRCRCSVMTDEIGKTGSEGQRCAAAAAALTCRQQERQVASAGRHFACRRHAEPPLGVCLPL